MSKTRQSQHRPLTPRTFCLVCPSPSISLPLPFSQSSGTLPPIIQLFFLVVLNPSYLHIFPFQALIIDPYIQITLAVCMLAFCMYVRPISQLARLAPFAPRKTCFLSQITVLFYTFQARSDNNRLLCLSVRFMSVCMYTYAGTGCSLNIFSDLCQFCCGC